MAKPPFRAEHVGSLLRPKELTTAFRQHNAGEIDESEIISNELSSLIERTTDFFKF